MASTEAVKTGLGGDRVARAEVVRGGRWDHGTIEHDPSCLPEHMSEPDDEGVRDCGNCGLWELPVRHAS